MRYWHFFHQLCCMTTTDSKTLRNFLLIARLEGISFLVLLGIAMPLKYWAGMPMAVKVFGWAHGILFILYFYLLVQVLQQHSWKAGRILAAIAASLLPFGTFVFERKLKTDSGAAA